MGLLPPEDLCFIPCEIQHEFTMCGHIDAYKVEMLKAEQFQSL